MIIRFGQAALIIPVIVYALAGTLHYWQGWLNWVVLIIAVLAAVSYFRRTDPELPEGRMKLKEKMPSNEP